MNIGLLRYFYTAMVKSKPNEETSEDNQGPYGLKALWKKFQTFYSGSLKLLFNLLFLLLMVHATYELFRYDLVIRPFEMPFDLSRQGYTGTVVAHRLQEHMEKIRQQIQRTSIQGNEQGVAAVQFTELQRQQEIDVPTIGLSLNSVIYQLRRMLGLNEQRVSGDMVVRDGQLHLTLRITDKLPFQVPPGDNLNNPEPLIEQAAQYVLETFEPLIFGQKYCLNRENLLLDTLIKKIQKDTILSHQEKAIIFTLESCLLKNQGDFEHALAKLAQAQRFNRKNPIIYLMRGDTLLESGQFAEAIQQYQMALRYDRNNGGIYTQWAKALLKQGLIEEAFAKYALAAQKDLDNPWVYTDWGEKLANYRHDFEGAEEKFNQAVTIDVDYALVYAIWGDVLRQAGDIEGAGKKYQRAIELDDTIAWVYGNWGWTLAKLGKNLKALKQYSRSLELKPSQWVYNDLEYILQRLKKPALFAQYEPIVSEQIQGTYYEKWGTALASLEQYQEAIMKYRKALELEPNEGFYYFRWANVLVDLGQYEAALSHYEKAINLKLDQKETLAWAYSGWGDALFGLKRYAEAATRYEQAAQLHLDKASLYGNWGNALLHAGQTQEAIVQYQKASILDESLNWVYSNWGLALARLKRYDEAITLYQRALTLQKEDWIYYEWGNALLNAKQYQKAIAQYQPLRSKLVWAPLKMGYALIQLQKYQAALTECRFVLENKAAHYKARSAAQALCGLALIGLQQPQVGLEKCEAGLILYDQEDWVYWCLGEAYIQLQQPELAVIQYKVATQLKPNKAFYYYRWGQGLAQLGEKEKAIIQYQRAIELDQAGEIGQQAQLSLDALKKE